MTLPDNRIAVVYNPNSSRIQAYGPNILSWLHEHHPILGGVHELRTQYSDAEANIEDLQEQIKAGDTVLAVGGDGAAHIALNAIITSGLHDRITAFGMLGVGNINDGALSLNGKNHIRNPAIATLASDPERVIEVRPLAIRMGSLAVRYGFSYASVGTSARVTQEFSTGPARKWLNRFHAHGFFPSAVAAIITHHTMHGEGALRPGIAYFTEGHNNHRPVITSDVAFLNGDRMAGMLRNKEAFYTKETFWRMEVDLPKNKLTAARTVIGLARNNGELPGREVAETTMRLNGCRTWLQVDGEILYDEPDSLSVYTPNLTVRTIFARDATLAA